MADVPKMHRGHIIKEEVKTTTNDDFEDDELQLKRK